MGSEIIHEFLVLRRFLGYLRQPGGIRFAGTPDGVIVTEMVEPIMSVQLVVKFGECHQEWFYHRNKSLQDFSENS